MLTLLTLMLVTAPTAAEGSAPAVVPAPPSAADSVVAAAFGKDVDTKPGELKVEPSFSAQNLIAPALGLAGLAVLAFTLKRRKQLAGGSIQIIEAASLGEKRSLVIADVLGERLVLGVSEAGVTVLLTRPAPEPEPEAYRVPSASPAPAMGIFHRLKAHSAAQKPFDDSLQESIEDQDLRAKLAAGMKGVVP
jgi:flagellar biogenesis protein FliO